MAKRVVKTNNEVVNTILGIEPVVNNIENNLSDNPDYIDKIEDNNQSFLDSGMNSSEDVEDNNNNPTIEEPVDNVPEIITNPNTIITEPTLIQASTIPDYVHSRKIKKNSYDFKSMAVGAAYKIPKSMAASARSSATQASKDENGNKVKEFVSVTPKIKDANGNMVKADYIEVWRTM